MATIKGQNLRLFLDGKAIAAATTCTVHVAMTFSDKSTKDSDDKWADMQPTGMNWDCSASALVTLDNGSSIMPLGVTADELVDMIGTEVDVLFSQASGTANRTSSGELYKGTAVVSDVQVNAPNREDSTLAIQLTGTGLLKRHATVSISASLPARIQDLNGETITFSAALGTEEVAQRLLFITSVGQLSAVISSDTEIDFYYGTSLVLTLSKDTSTTWSIDGSSSSLSSLQITQIQLF